jgi:hypothetical protein
MKEIADDANGCSNLLKAYIVSLTMKAYVVCLLIKAYITSLVIVSP